MLSPYLLWSIVIESRGLGKKTVGSGNGVAECVINKDKITELLEICCKLYSLSKSLLPVTVFTVSTCYLCGLQPKGLSLLETKHIMSSGCVLGQKCLPLLRIFILKGRYKACRHIVFLAPVSL